MQKHLRRGLHKTLLLTPILLATLVFLHLLSYANNNVEAEPRSATAKTVKKCQVPPPDSANETHYQSALFIPKVIHQIWKTADVSSYPAEASHESWKAAFEPLNYTVKLWTENDVVSLIKTNYSWLWSTYESYPENIQRADMARLVVVHAEGGVYADLDAFIMSVDGLVCLQHLGFRELFPPTGDGAGISNHFFMAEQASKFLLWALQEAKRRGGTASRWILLPYLQVFWSTGPMMMTSALQQYLWLNNEKDCNLGIFEDLYGDSVVHHAAGRSWQRLDGQLLNWTADHVELVTKWLTIGSLALALGFILVHMTSCQEHQKKDSLPFKHPIRLIDVNSMRLVVVDMKVSPTKYAALSYVWGPSPTMRLLTSNLQDFLREIPKEALPKTIRDAITVTRELNIGYIWIDALCIIQDSREDWAGQLISMSQVYHQAALCICAAYGSSSSTGIPSVASTPGRLRQNVEVYKEIPLTTLRPIAAIVSASPWDSRAWTFQERLLSTRCAIFTADGMIWQCPTTTWREDMESSLSRPAWTLDSVASPLQALQGNPLRSYINCVNIYSGRLLTIPSDKLVAFIGLSQVLSRGLFSELEHGMPLRYLDWALLWEPESAGKRIIAHDLVSWSWCGWERKVNWRFSTIEGTLFNLHNWLTEHTWIVWYLADGEKWNLAWNSRHFVEQEEPLRRWDGYNAGPHDLYGRSRDAIRCRDDRRYSIYGTFDEDDKKEIEWFKSQHRPDKGLLLFQTFTSWFALSRKGHSKQTDMGKDLHRFGLTDKLGDWCGTIILDKDWFNNVGGLFEFAAISDAKEFSFEELDTWNYYIPEERQQAEWYCFYALMLSWREDGNGRAVAERVGLAKIYQSSFFSRSFRPCSWKSIILS
ncbi:hypothetical protein CEP53_003996 [Fusarium sp. AF-6]|nr:hypothetical protein CEP53_003996 [Fusarium sp. AF-6]